MAVMALQLRHFPLSTSPSSSIEHNYDISRRFRYLPLPSHGTRPHLPVPSSRNRRSLACVGKEDTQLRQPSSTTDEQPEAQDLEYIRQIQRVCCLFLLHYPLLLPSDFLTALSWVPPPGTGASQEKQRHAL